MPKWMEWKGNTCIVKLGPVQEGPIVADVEIVSGWEICDEARVRFCLIKAV